MAKDELLNLVCLGPGLSSLWLLGGDQRLLGLQPGFCLHRLLGKLEPFLFWR